MRTSILAASVGWILGTGCVTTNVMMDAVSRRAAFELDCPADKLQVVALGGESFGAAGCGKRQVYVVQCAVGIDACTAHADRPDDAYHHRDHAK